MAKGFSIDKDKIIKILKDSAINAYTDVVCLSVAKNINSIALFKKFVSEIENPNDVIINSLGKTTITMLLHEKLLEKAKNVFSKEIRDINVKTGAIFLKCRKEVNTTPGITAYLSSLFADKNVAIYEMISTYTDYVIVINEKETFRMASYIKKSLGC
ncbi:hypothetical protein COX58_00325 [archaeon CG_4_10_14_0_2_um_filter_Archaea_38_6]|nr:MAG: hypothetical protein COS64_02110 [archaeon CG06_land_8_20_14_3_00_37_11]PJA23104.1 MAG: hypothetical protein COX58_00325 [archaeon CG_4_10_14_0_2_um_filter_Archaea_38_6]